MLNYKVLKLVQVQEYHYLARNEHIAFCHVAFLSTLCDDGGCCLHRKHVHLGFLYSKCNNTRKEKSKKATHSLSSDFLTCGKKKICVSAGKMFFIVGSYPAPVSGVCFKMMHWRLTVQIHSPLAAAELAEVQWIASGPDAFGCRLSLKYRSKRSNW